MVTRILFDPRRDLSTGGTVSTPVVVQATPTGVRDDGTIVVLPTTLNFTINTGADLLQLAPNAASWAWRITVITPDTGTILTTRTVRVPDVTSIAWRDLMDVDPASLQQTQGTARQWDATYAEILELITNLVITGGGSGGVDPEGVRDVIAAALQGGTNITVTPNDPDDKIVIATTATVNSTDAQLRDRATHTGTQTADTITDGTTNRTYTAVEKTKLAGIATGATLNRTDAATDLAISTAVNALVNGAPGALDQLNELAAAIGNDPNFATTLTNQLALKVPTSRTVAGKALTTDIALAKADVGLGNVDNTSDVNKPVSTLQQAALDAKAPLASPGFTGTPTVPTASAGASSTQVANTQFVTSALAGLIMYVDNGDGTATITGPGVTDNGDGTVTFTTSAGSVVYKKSQIDALVAGKAPLASPAFTGTPTAPTPATADSSTQVATTAFVKAQGYGAGGGAAVNVQVFTSNGTWTKPAGVSTVQVTVIGGGGGGGSGRRGASGAVAGGGGGGSGAGMSSGMWPAAALPATVAVTVGSAGAGGGAVATDTTNGSSGTGGGQSVFAGLLLANGGNAGGGGTTSAGAGGGSAGFAQFQGSAGAAGGAGAAGVQASSGTTAAAGGGGGGGISTAPAAFNGGIGGLAATTNTSAAAGVAPGGNGTAGNSLITGAPVPSGGGGGGASSTTGAGGTGGAGGLYGGGGGGGGASLNGFASGAGGAGSTGIIVVTAW